MSDSELWEGAKQARKKKAQRRQNSLVNIPRKMGLESRVRITNNGGSLLLDGRIVYHSKKKVAIVNGKKYHMRGVQHFLEVFSR